MQITGRQRKTTRLSINPLPFFHFTLVSKISHILTVPFSEPMSPMIYCSCFLLLPLLSNVYSTASTLSSKDWLIEFHQPVSAEAARRIAKRYAMVSRGPLIKDEQLYHFVDLKPTHPHKRKRRDVEQEEFIQRHQWVSRSVNYTASICRHTALVQVKRAIHQIPHVRVKRGYQPPKDPYFKYQWYLVSDIH